MARTADGKRRVATSSGTALAAVMLASPGFAAPTAVQQAGQIPSTESSAGAAAAKKSGIDWGRPGPLKLTAEYKHKGEYSVAGVGDGHIVFEDERGKLFYVDEVTGDQKFVTRKVFSKVELQRDRKHDTWIKLVNKVTILGVGDGGKLIMANKKGEKFHLDPVTGDMIFVP